MLWPTPTCMYVDQTKYPNARTSTFVPLYTYKRACFKVSHLPTQCDLSVLETWSPMASIFALHISLVNLSPTRFLNQHYCLFHSLFHIWCSYQITVTT